MDKKTIAHDLAIAMLQFDIQKGRYPGMPSDDDVEDCVNDYYQYFEAFLRNLDRQ